MQEPGFGTVTELRTMLRVCPTLTTKGAPGAESSMLITRHRRGRAVPPRGAAAFVFALAVGTCCGGSAHASPSCASVIGPLAPVTQKHDRAATGSTLDVDAANSAFDPTCVTDVPRGTVAVTFHNTGLVIHNVEITAQHIDVDVKPRDSVTIRIQVGADPVVYVCRYHRALGMVGVLIPASS